MASQHQQMRDKLNQATMRLAWALDRLGKNDDDAAMHLDMAASDIDGVLRVLDGSVRR